MKAGRADRLRLLLIRKGWLVDEAEFWDEEETRKWAEDLSDFA